MHNSDIPESDMSWINILENKYKCSTINLIMEMVQNHPKQIGQTLSRHKQPEAYCSSHKAYKLFATQTAGLIRLADRHLPTAFLSPWCAYSYATSEAYSNNTWQQKDHMVAHLWPILPNKFSLGVVVVVGGAWGAFGHFTWIFMKSFSGHLNLVGLWFNSTTSMKLAPLILDDTWL